MDNCERIVADFKGIQVKEPEEVLIRSVAEAQSPGSSTILVAHFDGQVLASFLHKEKSINILYISSLVE